MKTTKTIILFILLFSLILCCVNLSILLKRRNERRIEQIELIEEFIESFN